MRALATILAALATAALVTSCGGASGLIPSNYAATLQGDLTNIETDVALLNCTSTEHDLAAASSDLYTLPRSVSHALVVNLHNGIIKLARVAKKECRAPFGNGGSNGATDNTAATGASGATATTGVTGATSSASTTSSTATTTSSAATTTSSTATTTTSSAATTTTSSAATTTSSAATTTPVVTGPSPGQATGTGGGTPVGGTTPPTGIGGAGGVVSGN